MSKINNYFLNSEQEINPKLLKSGCLKRLFNIKPNSIVGTINNKSSKYLLFIYEKKCSLEELLLTSQLFLQTIKIRYPELIQIYNQQIFLGDHPISSFYHHHTKQSGVFCHSIILQKYNHNLGVAHLDILPKKFSIEITNAFSEQLTSINKIIKAS